MHLFHNKYLSRKNTKKLKFFLLLLPYCTRLRAVNSTYRSNAKYLQFDWLKQRPYLIFLIATVQISIECETRESEAEYTKHLNLY